MKISRRALFQSTAAAVAVGAGRPGVAGETARPLPAGRSFRGEALREIAFPLGGIGTGTISLGGYGNLRDFEIFNRPNKGGDLPFTFAALRLEGGGLSKPLVRVIERRSLPPYSGGFGAHREQALGLPRFREADFTGAYPFAELRFRDPRVPVEVTLEAFNPMIPLDTRNSSLPVAVLTYRLTSRAPARLQAVIAFSAMNPVGYDGRAKLSGTVSDRTAPFFGGNLNEFRSDGDLRGILMTSRKYPADSARHGSMALLTRGPDVSCRLAWETGEWWDDFQRWWDEFRTVGRFPGKPADPSPEGSTDYATLASHVTLEPGESRHVVFVLAWHFPNAEDYSVKSGTAPVFRNQYGTLWGSAWEPAAYTFRNLSSLRDRSARYRDTLHGSTLPFSVIDAVSSQASILRTNTLMVAENGLTLAFEGCADDSGCCPMNCTHVFNYEQALAHLYPDLERSMRETDFLVNMRPDGSMSFRTPVPLRPGGDHNPPAADGQMGCVMKVYREWLLCGDDEWLRRLWPGVKRALEYAWVQWDADRDGVMEGEQHNTYDIRFFGPNSMMGTLYLGALAAASRMARHLGDAEAAEKYADLQSRGAGKLDGLLWNGEYYVQKVDEVRRPVAKYQFGEGCLSDQLLGQWFAEVVGLGSLLPHDRIRTTLGSIFRYNFRRDFEEFANTQRIYAVEDEAGLLVCSWPRGRRPALPFIYSDEVWTGIEYQVAAHMAYEGMVKEATAIVDAVRARYNGERRNPWDEVECGHHYARAMASWSLLTAFSGFRYSAPSRELAFRPRVNTGAFRSLFTTGSCWGTYRQSLNRQFLEAAVSVEEGRMELAALSLPFTGRHARVSCAIPAETSIGDGTITFRFNPPAKLGPAATLAVRADVVPERKDR